MCIIKCYTYSLVLYINDITLQRNTVNEVFLFFILRKVNKDLTNEDSQVNVVKNEKNPNIFDIL